MKCDKCGRDTFLPFRCPSCGHSFCSEHRLPENHGCTRAKAALNRTEEIRPRIVQQQESYEYAVAYPVQDTEIFNRLRVSRKEIAHLVVAAVLVTGVGLSYVGFPAILSATYGTDYVVLALSVTIFAVSFLTHELAHKTVAQRTGCWAEFRLNALGAVVTLLSIFPTFFKVISPGAVMISGFADRKTMGKISVAGPTTNVAFSAAFLGVSFLFPDYSIVFHSGMALNAWMALFNLIPFGFFDGFKIYLWNRKVWAIAFASSMILATISFALFY